MKKNSFQLITLVAAFVVAFVSSASAQATAAASQTTPVPLVGLQPVTVNLDPNAGWTNTGIKLVPGYSYRIKVRGEVIAALDSGPRSCGSQGIEHNSVTDRGLLGSIFNPYIVLARLGYDGGVKDISGEDDLRPESEDQRPGAAPLPPDRNLLFLGINSSTFQGNSKGFTVTVSPVPNQ